jgi:hypothetical protein
MNTPRDLHITHRIDPPVVHMVEVAFHLCWVAACRCGWSVEAGNSREASIAANAHASANPGLS